MRNKDFWAEKGISDASSTVAKALRGESGNKPSLKMQLGAMLAGVIIAKMTQKTPLEDVGRIILKGTARF